MASKSELDIIIKAKDEASGVLKGLSGSLDKLVGLAGGAGLAGLTALASGITAVGAVGLGFNSAMEEASARINAFTKDGTATAAILDMLQERAAATPFAFEEMTNAAAGLLPAATQSGTALEELIAQAEILAASNPAQGLEGAAFAIKEALGGDFQSVIERFNLSRQSINAMKEQGVPAMEILGRAMAEMGLDAGLVSAMAETASGRWSTLSDSFTTLAGKVTQPIFDTFSGGLEGINQWVSDNEATLSQYADNVAGGIKEVIGIISLLAGGNSQAALQDFQASLFKLGLDPEQVTGISEGITSIVEDANRIGEAFGRIFGGVDMSAADVLVVTFEKIASAVEIIAGLSEQVAGVIDTVTNSPVGQAGGQFGQAFVENITPDLGEMPAALGQFQQWQNMSFLNPVVATGGLAAIPQAAGIDMSALAGAIVSAFQSAAPIQVNTPPITLDGRVISEQVGSHLGSQANQVRRAGAAPNF